MSVRKAIKKVKALRLSIKSKLILSLLSIAAILLVSSTISVMEYSSERLCIRAHCGGYLKH